MPFPPLHLWPQRLALASAILLAAGCVTSEGLEPNARLQPAGALQAGRSLDGVALSPAAWPRQDWWTGLGDRQLDQLIGEALQGTPDLQIAEARARQAAATAQAQDAARPQPLNPASLSLPSVLPAELLGRRADIVAARWRVEAARRNIDSAKTEFYPNLNLGAMAGLAALHTSDVLQAPSRFFQVAPAISLPIFDGGRRRANLAERDADYDLAVGQYNKTLVQALGEVSDNLGKLRSLEQQVIDQRQARDIARSNFDLAMRRYGEGVGSYLDALSVQQQLLVTERQLASLESQQIDLSVQLVQALGGGFQPDSRSAALATAKAPAE